MNDNDRFAMMDSREGITSWQEMLEWMDFAESEAMEFEAEYSAYLASVNSFEDWMNSMEEI